ncbi:MAG: NUDIX domain-containing protein [Candidatus Hydrogenedentes bacterium]|nr:NUDIX domain-containing protein [Candidatus Hydrogenedentota bacterium]
MTLMIDEAWYRRPEALTRERVSAGGVVVRIERGNLLVRMVREIEKSIGPLDGFVLPKGGVDPGEDLVQTACREIHEEAGITELEYLGELALLERQDVNREYWAFNHYLLFVTGQVDGDLLDKDHHFDPGWFPLDTLPQMFWPDEQRMLEERRLEIYDRVITHQNPKPRKQGFM